MPNRKIIAVICLMACATFAASAYAQSAAAPAKSVKPIDFELIAKKLKRGKFIAESTEVGADGVAKTSTDAMCMDEMSANILPFGIMGGLAGCDPESTSEDALSFAVSGTCSKGPALANFYTGSLRWSADGKTIESESTRLLLKDGKPSEQVLKSIKSKLKFQSASCK